MANRPHMLKFKLGSEAWGINKRNHIVKKQTGQKAVIYNRCHSLMANKYCKHKVLAVALADCVSLAKLEVRFV